MTTEVNIITSLPTKFPTASTLVPSAAPSFTGIVVTMTLTQPGASFDDFDSITNDIASAYGVDVNDVRVDPTYSIGGTMQLDSIPDGISEDDLIDSIQHSIADTLGVHPNDVDVSVDFDSGEVTFAINSDDNAAALDVQHVISSPEFLAEINTKLDDVEVDSLAVDDDVMLTVEVMVAASNASNDILDTNEALVELYEAQGFQATIRCNLCLSFEDIPENISL